MMAKKAKKKMMLSEDGEMEKGNTHKKKCKRIKK